MTIPVVQLVLLAFFGFSVIAGLLVSIATELVCTRIAGWPPEARHRLLMLVATAPTLLAGSATVAVFTPSLLAIAWPGHDHCLVHPGHVHLCFVHHPPELASPWAWLMLLSASAWVTIAAARALLGIVRAVRWGASLSRRAALAGSLGARLLPTPRPFCLIFGLLRPLIVLSQGLVNSVSADELRAILAHERAHAVRRDTLLRLLASASTFFMVPAKRAVLLDQLELAAEQSSDEAAAAAVGDRLLVASAILRVERLLQPSSSVTSLLATSFGGVGVPERVAALLEAPRPARTIRFGSLLLAGTLVTLVGGSIPFHHAVETLLGVLLP